MLNRQKKQNNNKEAEHHVQREFDFDVGVQPAQNSLLPPSVVERRVFIQNSDKGEFTCCSSKIPVDLKEKRSLKVGEVVSGALKLFWPPFPSLFCILNVALVEIHLSLSPKSGTEPYHVRA